MTQPTVPPSLAPQISCITPRCNFPFGGIPVNTIGTDSIVLDTVDIPYNNPMFINATFYIDITHPHPPDIGAAIRLNDNAPSTILRQIIS